MQDYPQGAGSGVVWDQYGHVVTNYHVIKGASSVTVTLNGGQEYVGTVIGMDEDRDVAVLLIKDQALPVGVAFSASVYQN